MMKVNKEKLNKESGGAKNTQAEGNRNVNTNMIEEVKKPENIKSPNDEQGFFELKPDQKMQAPEIASQSRTKKEDQSVARAGSIYRSESISSISQTMKGTRWSFGSKLETDDKNTFIFIPQECIKLRYRVLEILTATAYGEIMRIQLQSKAAEEKKVGEGQEGSLRAKKAPNFEGAYFLITV